MIWSRSIRQGIATENLLGGAIRRRHIKPESQELAGQEFRKGLPVFGNKIKGTDRPGIIFDHLARDPKWPEAGPCGDCCRLGQWTGQRRERRHDALRRDYAAA